MGAVVVVIFDNDTWLITMWVIISLGITMWFLPF